MCASPSMCECVCAHTRNSSALCCRFLWRELLDRDCCVPLLTTQIYNTHSQPSAFHISSPERYISSECFIAISNFQHISAIPSPSLSLCLISHVCQKHLCCILWGVRVTEPFNSLVWCFDTWAMCDMVVSAWQGNFFCTTNVSHEVYFSQCACTTEARKYSFVFLLVIVV